MLRNASRYESRIPDVQRRSGEVFRRVTADGAKLKVVSHIDDAWAQERWDWVKFERLDAEGESTAARPNRPRRVSTCAEMETLTLHAMALPASIGYL